MNKHAYPHYTRVFAIAFMEEIPDDVNFNVGIYDKRVEMEVRAIRWGTQFVCRHALTLHEVQYFNEHEQVAHVARQVAKEMLAALDNEANTWEEKRGAGDKVDPAYEGGKECAQCGKGKAPFVNEIGEYLHSECADAYIADMMLREATTLPPKEGG